MEVTSSLLETTSSNDRPLYIKPADSKVTRQEVSVHNNENYSSSQYVALVKRKKVQKPLLTTLDFILSLLVLGPCVVGFWRGTWVLMDINHVYFPACQSLLLGLTVHFVFSLTQNVLNDFVKKKHSTIWRKIFNMFIPRVYTYIFAIACNMHWRGGWQLIDKYLGVQTTASGVIVEKGSGPLLIATIGCLLLIIGFRSLCNCLAPPFVFSLDRKDRTFTIPTRFKTKMKEKWCLYVLDCLFSVLVIGTLVVFVWRGSWALIDILLFPENEIWSAWSSLILGYAVVAITFMLQPFMRWLCDRITGVTRLLAADLFLILSFIGTVNVWRGIWNLLNIYLLPDNLELSCWLTHWFGIIILILMGCANSLLVRGVYIDAEEPAGKCVMFPCYYLRLIFQELKLKKLKQQQDKGEMDNVKPFENNHVTNVPNSEQCEKSVSVSLKEGNV